MGVRVGARGGISGRDEKGMWRGYAGEGWGEVMGGREACGGVGDWSSVCMMQGGGWQGKDAGELWLWVRRWSESWNCGLEPAFAEKLSTQANCSDLQNSPRERLEIFFAKSSIKTCMIFAVGRPRIERVEMHSDLTRSGCSIAKFTAAGPDVSERPERS